MKKWKKNKRHRKHKKYRRCHFKLKLNFDKDTLKFLKDKSRAENISVNDIITKALFQHIHNL